MRATVLLVDDEQPVLDALSQLLHKADYRLLTSSGPEAALEVLRRETVDIVVSDERMPGMSGLELLSLVHDRQPNAIRIILTGHADTDTAVRAINEGEIYRFLTKPCDRTELLVTLHLAREKLELERQNRELRALVETSPQLADRLREMQASRAEGADLVAKPGRPSRG